MATEIKTKCSDEIFAISHAKDSEYLQEASKISDERDKCTGIGQCINQTEFNILNKEFIHILHLVISEHEISEIPYLRALHTILTVPHMESYTHVLTTISKCRNKIMYSPIGTKYYHIIKFVQQYIEAKDLLICMTLI